MNKEQKAFVASLGTALYKYLRSQDFSKTALDVFKSNFDGTSGNVVDIQAYDDIHLMFFKFPDSNLIRIIAVGDFSADPYTLFNHFKEELIDEHVFEWVLDSETPRNPILQFHKRINHYPTIECSASLELAKNGDFTTEVVNETDEIKTYLIKGVQGTETDGYSVCADIKKSDSDCVGFSTVISKRTTDGFFLVEDGVEIDQDIMHYHTLLLVNRVLKLDKPY